VLERVRGGGGRGEKGGLWCGRMEGTKRGEGGGEME